MQFITEHRIPANSQTDRPPLHLDIQLPCLFWSLHPPYRCSSGLDKYMECQSPNTGAAYESGQYALHCCYICEAGVMKTHRTTKMLWHSFSISVL